jgi:hypothetical protein
VNSQNKHSSESSVTHQLEQVIQQVIVIPQSSRKTALVFGENNQMKPEVHLVDFKIIFRYKLLR